ncbi:MAG: ankyrin repeat domain-containing protein, partial [Gammaproteobacteria bacterium]
MHENQCSATAGKNRTFQDEVTNMQSTISSQKSVISRSVAIIAAALIAILFAPGSVPVCADVNAENNNHWTPLHQAAREGRTDVVKALIAAGAGVNAKGKGGVT